MLVAWERLPNGKFGPIQRDGGVRLGDILLRLNTVDLHQRRFEDVMTMLRNPGILNKRLTFVSKEKVRGVEGLWGHNFSPLKPSLLLNLLCPGMTRASRQN